MNLIEEMVDRAMRDLIADLESPGGIDRARARRRACRSGIGGSTIPTIRLVKKFFLAEDRRFGLGDHDLGGEG